MNKLYYQNNDDGDDETNDNNLELIQSKEKYEKEKI